MKKLLAIMLTAALAASSPVILSEAAQSRGVEGSPAASERLQGEGDPLLDTLSRNDVAPAFDASDIAFTFGAIADIHITPEDDSSATRLYRQALTGLKKFAGGRLDALTIAGDICELEYNAETTAEFIKVNNEDISDTPVFFVSGNHDAISDHPEWMSAFFGDLACYTEADLPSARPLEGNRHAVINGYHFIGVGMMDYYTSEGAKFTQQNLDWLSAALAEARADAPGRFIFVYMHPQIANTTWCSDYRYACYNVYDVLADYPEAVVFTGHYHTPNYTNTTVYQKDFTVVNPGNVAFMCIEGGYLDMDGLKVAESYSTSDGMLAQVDSNGNLRLTRINFNSGKMIKDYLYIDAPDLENKTHLRRYDPEEIAKTNAAPAFPADAAVSVKTEAGAIAVTFTAAQDDEMVQHYEFQVRGVPSGMLTSAKAYSDFYLYDRVGDFPKEYTKKIPTYYMSDTEYEVTITAVDSYGKKSEPLVYNTAAPGPAYAAAPGGNLLNVDFITGDARNATPLNAEVSVSGGRVSAEFCGKSAFDCADGGRVVVSAPASVYSMTAQAFTAEATFLAGTAGSDGAAQYILSCEKQSKGYAIFIDGNGFICAEVYTKSGLVTLKSGTKAASGALYHAVLTLGSGTAALYVNGKKAASASAGAPSYTTTAPFVLGAKQSNGSDGFAGMIFNAGVYKTALTAEEAASAFAAVNAAFSYKAAKVLYEEAGWLKLMQMRNTMNDAAPVCGDYADEVDAALRSAKLDEAYVARVLRRDDFLAKVALVGGSSNTQPVPAPVISGVEDGGVYSQTEGVTPAWGQCEFAEMNYAPAESGTKLTAPGEYQLIVRIYGKVEIVEFTIAGDEMRGDLDGDGEITVADALAALRIAARLVEPTGRDLRLGDTDGDGSITVADALAILRVAAKLTASL